jgi:hypothetical protein
LRDRARSPVAHRPDGFDSQTWAIIYFRMLVAEQRRDLVQKI